MSNLNLSMVGASSGNVINSSLDDVLHNREEDALLPNDVTTDLVELNISDDDELTGYEEVEDRDVDLEPDEVVNYICDALCANPKLIYNLSRNDRICSALKQISEAIDKIHGYNIDVVDCFKNVPEVTAAVKLIAKGFIARPKFQHAVKNPVKIILVPDVNNIHITENAIAQGVHRYKTSAAVTRVSATLINKARGYLGSYQNFQGLLDACKDIELPKAQKVAKVSSEFIRKLSKRELGELVLSGELRVSDLYRANVNKKVIDSIRSLI